MQIEKYQKIDDTLTIIDKFSFAGQEKKKPK